MDLLSRSLIFIPHALEWGGVSSHVAENQVSASPSGGHLDRTYPKAPGARTDIQPSDSGVGRLNVEDAGQQRIFRKAVGQAQGGDRNTPRDEKGKFTASAQSEHLKNQKTVDVIQKASGGRPLLGP